MFSDAPASGDRATVTIDPTAAATTRPADATFGDRTAAASAWASSKSGANKSAPAAMTTRSVRAEIADIYEFRVAEEFSLAPPFCVIFDSVLEGPEGFFVY